MKCARKKVELATGGTVEGPSEAIDMLAARDRFIKEYCAEQGWEPKDLTIQQILEIRGQEGWKQP